MSVREDGRGINKRFRVLLQGNLLESFKTYNEAVQFIKDNVELVK